MKKQPEQEHFHWAQTIHACTRFILYSVSPSEVPSALADERSWCDGDRSFAVCSGWSCLGFLISLCHCIPVGEGTYTQGKSVNTNLICMEKVTVISSDSKSLWATQQHKESLPPQYCCQIPTLSYYGRQGSCHWEACLYPPLSVRLPERPVHACMWLRWAW